MTQDRKSQTGRISWLYKCRRWGDPNCGFNQSDLSKENINHNTANCRYREKADLECPLWKGTLERGNK